MAENKTTEHWWANLFKSNKADKWTGGYTIVEEASRVLEESTESEREAKIESLMKIAIQKGKGFQLALAVLERHCTATALIAIYEKAKTLNASDSEIVDYLRVLGKHGKEEHRHLLEAFLLSDPLNKNHSLVQWSVYPRFPELFSMAYSKYLIETDYRKWTGSGIVQAFMDRPEALKVLKSYLEKQNREVWLKFRADIEAELRKDIWKTESKAEIKKII